MLAPSRRAILIGLGTTAIVAAVGYSWSQKGSANQTEMTPPEVLEAVRRKKIMLVDVRRPDEWKSTGLAEGALPIDLRRNDFIDAIKDKRPSDTHPIVMICARGVRSRRMTAHLAQAGLAPVINVPEGMLGSAAGPGWLKRGLPVVAWAG